MRNNMTSFNGTSCVMLRKYGSEETECVSFKKFWNEYVYPNFKNTIVSDAFMDYIDELDKYYLVYDISCKAFVPVKALYRNQITNNWYRLNIKYNTWKKVYNVDAPAEQRNHIMYVTGEVRFPTIEKGPIPVKELQIGDKIVDTNSCRYLENQYATLEDIELIGNIDNFGYNLITTSGRFDVDVINVYDITYSEVEEKPQVDPTININLEDFSNFVIQGYEPIIYRDNNVEYGTKGYSWLNTGYTYSHPETYTTWTTVALSNNTANKPADVSDKDYFSLSDSLILKTSFSAMNQIIYDVSAKPYEEPVYVFDLKDANISLSYSYQMIKSRLEKILTFNYTTLSVGSNKTSNINTRSVKILPSRIASTTSDSIVLENIDNIEFTMFMNSNTLKLVVTDLDSESEEDRTKTYIYNDTMHLPHNLQCVVEPSISGENVLKLAAKPITIKSNPVKLNTFAIYTENEEYSYSDATAVPNYTQSFDRTICRNYNLESGNGKYGWTSNYHYHSDIDSNDYLAEVINGNFQLIKPYVIKASFYFRDIYDDTKRQSMMEYDYTVPVINLNNSLMAYYKYRSIKDETDPLRKVGTLTYNFVVDTTDPENPQALYTIEQNLTKPFNFDILISVDTDGKVTYIDNYSGKIINVDNAHVTDIYNCQAFQINVRNIDFRYSISPIVIENFEVYTKK